jgi:hypothetical protein
MDPSMSRAHSFASMLMLALACAAHGGCSSGPAAAGGCASDADCAASKGTFCDTGAGVCLLGIGCGDAACAGGPLNCNDMLGLCATSKPCKSNGDCSKSERCDTSPGADICVPFVCSYEGSECTTGDGCCSGTCNAGTCG